MPTSQQYGWDGASVGVAILDSGIDFFQELRSGASQLVYSQSFPSGGRSARDIYGHGTHVAGIVSGSGNGSTGQGAVFTFRGIAPAVNLINLSVLGKSGSGTDGAVIAAIDRPIALKALHSRDEPLARPPGCGEHLRLPPRP